MVVRCTFTPWTLAPEDPLCTVEDPEVCTAAGSSPVYGKGHRCTGNTRNIYSRSYIWKKKKLPYDLYIIHTCIGLFYLR